jgi:hypothetical protein
MQNRAPGGYSVWQLGHLRGNASPQFIQKRAISGFSVWQRGHCITNNSNLQVVEIKITPAE